MAWYDPTSVCHVPCAAGRDIYVDVAGWHLFMRDMNAVPGLKMSEALATQLGPKASRGAILHGPAGNALAWRACSGGGGRGGGHVGQQ